MDSALQDASRKQGVACCSNRPQEYIKRISTNCQVAESEDVFFFYDDFHSIDKLHLAPIGEVWPKKSMQSCLASPAPIPKADMLECKCSPRVSSISLDQADNAGQKILVIAQEGWRISQRQKMLWLVIACIILLCVVALASVGTHP